MSTFENPSNLPVKAIATARQKSSWCQRYGEKHRMVRVPLPTRTAPLRKVRIYLRGEDRWLLQWWDRAEKKNVAHTLKGDFVDAIAKAREIDQRLVATRRSGYVATNGDHKLLLERFRADLQRRVDAEEIEVSTHRRYVSSLNYYELFVEQPQVLRKYPTPLSIDRDRNFVHELMLYVRQHPLRGKAANPEYVCGVVRAMYLWAQDSDGGNLLPDYFHSPFSMKGSRARKIVTDLLSDPDITMDMAVDLVGACDLYQLRLFAPMALLGLRPSELCFLFHEYMDTQWLRVRCNLDIGYKSKGKRDKRFPLFEPLKGLLKRAITCSGLLYLRRAVVEGEQKTAPLLDVSLECFAQHFVQRTRRVTSAADRLAVRDKLIYEAGGTDYDRIEDEFRKLARQLQWPAAATMKDLRHLFATTIANAGMPENYRQYLMGQAPTAAPIGIYTHLNDLPRQFNNAIEQAFAPLIDAINKRLSQINQAAKAAKAA